jgi:hypothetical protein
MEIETFDYVLNLTSEKMQGKWKKNCHAIAQEERLVPTLRPAEISFVPICNNIFSSQGIDLSILTFIFYEHSFGNVNYKTFFI